MPISQLENELLNFLPTGSGQEVSKRIIRRVFHQWDVDVNDLVTLEEKMRGTALVEEDGSLTRYLPWKDPDAPLLRCDRVDFAGHGYGNDRVDAEDIELPMTTAIVPQRWMFTVHYARLPYECGEGESTLDDPPYIYGTPPTSETERFASKIARPGITLVTPPAGTFYFDQGGAKRLPIGYPLPQALPYQELDVTWYWLPDGAYPISAIKDCLGKVNGDDLVLPAGRDGVTIYPAETIQLEAVRDTVVVFADGSLGVHIHYAFLYKDGLGRAEPPEAIHWNTKPDNLGIWRRVYRSDNTNVTTSLWDTTDFSWLFKTQLAWDLEP